jgi:hypothetical protein
MAGIGCEEEARPILRGNRCRANADAGIGSRGGARPILEGNLCEENRSAGIGLGEASRAIIVGNICRENRLVALGIPDGSRAIAVGNTFSRSGEVPPLVALRRGSQAILADNTLRGGGVATVLVEGRALLQGNRFENPAAHGAQRAVWVRKDSFLATAENRFEGFSKIIDADSTATVRELDGPSARE